MLKPCCMTQLSYKHKIIDIFNSITLEDNLYLK